MIVDGAWEQVSREFDGRYTGDHPLKIARMALEILRLRQELVLKSTDKPENNPPRRLREYVSTIEGVTRRYRVRNGVLKVSADGGAWVEATTVYVADAAGVADLLANPEEKIETLEEVVEKFSDDVSWLSPDARKWLCTRLRAHLSQQTPSESSFGDCRCGITLTGHVNALVEMGVRRVDNVHTISKDGWSEGIGYSSILILPSEVSP